MAVLTKRTSDIKEKDGFLKNANLIKLLSAIMFLVTLIMPMSNFGILKGNIFPNSESIYFVDAIRIFTNTVPAYFLPVEFVDCYFAFQLGIISISTALVLHILSYAKSRIGCIIASSFGIIGLFLPVYFLIGNYRFSYVVGLRHCILSIGYWLVFGLLITCLVYSIKE